MKPNLAQSATKSAKSLAQQIAKQVADESNEILRTATSQVTGSEKPFVPEMQGPPQTESQQAQMISHQQELQDKMKSSRLMEAFKRELEDIHKQDVFRDLQNRIAQGEQVPIEDYPELSMEQKQVLKAQMEAVSYQIKQSQYMQAQEGGALFGSSKKGRKMGGGNKGQKGEAEKQQTRVEKPVPPSG